MLKRIQIGLAGLLVICMKQKEQCKLWKGDWSSPSTSRLPPQWHIYWKWTEWSGRYCEAKKKIWWKLDLQLAIDVGIGAGGWHTSRTWFWHHDVLASSHDSHCLRWRWFALRWSRIRFLCSSAFGCLRCPNGCAISPTDRFGCRSSILWARVGFLRWLIARVALPPLRFAAAFMRTWFGRCFRSFIPQRFDNWSSWMRRRSGWWTARIWWCRWALFWIRLRFASFSFNQQLFQADLRIFELEKRNQTTKPPNGSGHGRPLAISPWTIHIAMIHTSHM